MVGFILGAQGMNFPTKNQALLFLRNARKPSACQSLVFITLFIKLYDTCFWCVIDMILSKSA
jgi:hypothetical protein